MDFKNILKTSNFKFEKKFGQNFLTDMDLLTSIVKKSGVDKNSTVVEIGVGAGTLTSAIASEVKKVYGFEIDKNLKPILEKTLAEHNNIELVFQDIMKIPIQELEEKIGENYTVIANLPYYITTPIIMNFIEQSKKCDRIVVTIQKEVAERICAKAKTSDYGAITASINAVCNSEIIEYIGREKFYPSPNVDSAVCKITFVENKIDIRDIKEYRKLVKTAFLMRRKTLVNNLMSGYNLDRQTAENLLTSLGYETTVRGEELEAEDYAKLSNEIICRGI